MKTPKRIRNHVNPMSDLKEITFDGFDDKKNIIVDIGSYRGEFGERLLEKFGEDKNFIFFEIRKPFYLFLKEKFKGHKNVVVFDGDAGRNLQSILESSIKKNVFIEKIFINFPDPWFKEKHKKRRLVNESFLESLEKWLPEKTEIIFQTDQKQLYKDTKAIIKNSKTFKKRKLWWPLWGIRTYWEEMKIKEGSKIYRIKILRK